MIQSSCSSCPRGSEPALRLVLATYEETRKLKVNIEQSVLRLTHHVRQNQWRLVYRHTDQQVPPLELSACFGSLETHNYCKKCYLLGCDVV